MMDVTPDQLTDSRVKLHKGEGYCFLKKLPKGNLPASAQDGTSRGGEMEEEGQDLPDTSPGYTAGQTGFTFTAAPSRALLSCPFFSLPGPLTSHPFRHQTAVKTLLHINKDSSDQTYLIFFKKIGKSS